jgi:hypothetical protein
MVAKLSSSTPFSWRDSRHERFPWSATKPADCRAVDWFLATIGKISCTNSIDEAAAGTMRELGPNACLLIHCRGLDLQPNISDLKTRLHSCWDRRLDYEGVECYWRRTKAKDQGRTQRGRGGGGGGGGGTTSPLENTIFTIFRMTLLIILWVFGTFFGIYTLLPVCWKTSCLRPCEWFLGNVG